MFFIILRSTFQVDAVILISLDFNDKCYSSDQTDLWSKHFKHDNPHHIFGFIHLCTMNESTDRWRPQHFLSTNHSLMFSSSMFGCQRIQQSLHSNFWTGSLLILFLGCGVHSVNLLFYLLSFLLNTCPMKHQLRIFISQMSIKPAATSIYLFILLIFSILLSMAPCVVLHLSSMYLLVAHASDAYIFSNSFSKLILSNSLY